jgi:hypothetical protein
MTEPPLPVNIVNGDPHRIDRVQFSLLIEVIQQIALSGIRDYPYTNIWRIITGRDRQSKIIITNSVHFAELDPNGKHHFDIAIATPGVIRSNKFHVYVEPVPDCDVLTYLPDTTTILNPEPCRWRWNSRLITE